MCMHAALFLCCPLTKPFLLYYKFLSCSHVLFASISLAHCIQLGLHIGAWVRGYLLKQAQFTTGYIMEECDLWQPLTANSSWGRSKPHQRMMESWWAQPCAALVQVATATVRSWQEPWMILSKGGCFTPLLILGSYILLPLLPCFLSLGEDGIDAPFMTEHYAVSSSLYFDHLWASAITITHFKGKILWSKAENCPNLWA